MIKRLMIDDYEYKIEIPESYFEPSRLTYVRNRAGMYATNPKGKRRFFPATRTYYEKTSN